MTDRPTELETQADLEAQARADIEAGPPDDVDGCDITPADATFTAGDELPELEPDPGSEPIDDDDELGFVDDDISIDDVPPVSGGDHPVPADAPVRKVYDGVNGRVVTQAVPAPTGLTKSEPALVNGGGVSGILAAAWLIMKASGVDVTEDMRAGVELLVWALLATPFVTGLLIRFQVFSPATSQKMANLSYAKAAGGEPPVNVGKPPEGALEDAA